MKKALIITLVIVVVLLVLRGINKRRKALKIQTTNGTAQTQSAEVPSKYQSLYTLLEGQLQDFDRKLGSSSQSGKEPLYATELLAANCNRGEALLTPQTTQGVELSLDRLKSLGVNAVTFCMSYPLLSPDYPRNGEYLDFYKKVAEAVRTRNMKLIVETGYIFPQKEFGGTKVDYSSLTFEKVKQAKRWYVETIIKEVKPDYLVFGSELTTMADLTKLSEFRSPERYLEMVQYVASDLDRGNTLIGAGSGTWDDPTFLERLAANTTVDFIDLHIYPVNHDFLNRLITMTDTAHSHGKRVIVSEAWLYKASDSELGRGGVAATPAIFARDTYGFWAPLDAEFLRLLVKFARMKGVDAVSPFWMNYFFSYLDYSDDLDRLPAGDILNRAYKDAGQNMSSGTATSTGRAYQEAIAAK